MTVWEEYKDSKFKLNKQCYLDDALKEKKSVLTIEAARKHIKGIAAWKYDTIIQKGMVILLT